MQDTSAVLIALSLLAVSVRAEEPVDAAAEVTAKLDMLDTDFAAAMKDLMDRYRAAHAAGEKFDYVANHPGKTFVPKWKEIAKAHAGTEHAARALASIATKSMDGKLRQSVSAQLVKEHPLSPHIKSVIYMLGNNPDALKMLAEKNPDPTIKGNALFLIGQGQVRTDAEGARKRLLAVKEKYGDVLVYDRFKIAARVDAILFELDNLGVGKTAPEIEGEDVDRVDFKLSDYRGKIILLDFWGDW